MKLHFFDCICSAGNHEGAFGAFSGFPFYPGEKQRAFYSLDGSRGDSVSDSNERKAEPRINTDDCSRIDLRTLIP